MASSERAANPSQLLERALEELDQLISHHWRQGPAAVWEQRSLTLSQVHLLLLLQELGESTVGQLAEKLHVSVPSASVAVDRLVDAGLAARKRDDEDRRLVHVELSEKGHEAAGDVSGFRRRKAEALLGGFTEPELEALLSVLSAVRRALEAGSVPGHADRESGGEELSS